MYSARTISVITINHMLRNVFSHHLHKNKIIHLGMTKYLIQLNESLRMELVIRLRYPAGTCRSKGRMRRYDAMRLDKPSSEMHRASKKLKSFLCTYFKDGFELKFSLQYTKLYIFLCTERL